MASLFAGFPHPKPRFARAFTTHFQPFSTYVTSASSGTPIADVGAESTAAQIGSTSAEDSEQDRDKFGDKALHQEQLVLERRNKAKVKKSKQILHGGMFNDRGDCNDGWHARDNVLDILVLPGHYSCCK